MRPAYKPSGLAAAFVAALLASVPAQHAIAATLGSSDAQVLTDETGDIFIDSWQINGTTTDIYPDAMFQGQGFFVRGTLTQESLLGDTVEQLSGDSMLTGPLGQGGAGPDLDVDGKTTFSFGSGDLEIAAEYLLTGDAPDGDSASLAETFVLTNTTSTDMAVTRSFLTLDFFIYNFADLNVGGPDTGALSDAGGNGLDTFTQTAPGGKELVIDTEIENPDGSTGAPTQARMAAFSAIIDALMGATFTGDLDSMDIVGGTQVGDLTTDHVTVAFLYSLVLEAGESATITVNKRGTYPVVAGIGVPEPASIALLALGGLLLVGASRRRS